MTWGVLSAQEFQEISTGTGYNLQSYVNIGDGTSKQVANNAWDIAFSIDPQDAGVFINESVGSTPGASAIQLFFTLSEDFSEVPDTGSFHDFPLSNSERSWIYGAFNEIRGDQNPFDFGWGIYDPQTHHITGNHVFVVRLRDGTDLKIQIQSLIDGTYTFRYANLDGSNEVNKTIVKGEHSGLLAYYSFNTESIVDVEPVAGFDMVFLRYTTPLPDPGGGEPIPYLLTGILSGAGVEVAQADGVDPETVLFSDFVDSLSFDIEVIGHDWKSFDLNAFMWIIPEDLVYFIRTPEDRVWKIQFIDFEGSSTGTTVFQKTDLGIISAIEDPNSRFETFDVYPNPVSEQANVVFTVKESVKSNVRIQLLDLHGRVVSGFEYPANQGLNVVNIPTNRYIPGLYILRLALENEILGAKIQIAGPHGE
jgi:hypothetical protein